MAFFRKLCKSTLPEWELSTRVKLFYCDYNCFNVTSTFLQIKYRIACYSVFDLKKFTCYIETIVITAK